MEDYNASYMPPLRPFPKDPPREFTEPADLPPEWLAHSLRTLLEAVSDATALIEDKSHRVNEYQATSVTLAAESLTQVQVLADYEYPEIIETVIVTGPTITTAQQTGSKENSNTIAAPAAGTTIASVSVPAGTWQISAWSVELQGTLAAADANNFGLYSAAALQLQSENLAVAGVYPQSAPLVIVTSGTTTLSVKSIGAATVGSSYTATLVAVPLSVANGTGTPFTLILGARVWNIELPPTGILVLSPLKMSLDRDNLRQVQSGTAGPWALELQGHADIRYRYK